MQACPHVLTLFGSFETKEHFIMCCALAPCDLFKLMRDHGGTTAYRRNLRIYAAQVRQAQGSPPDVPYGAGTRAPTRCSCIVTHQLRHCFWPRRCILLIKRDHVPASKHIMTDIKNSLHTSSLVKASHLYTNVQFALVAICLSTYVYRNVCSSFVFSAFSTAHLCSLLPATPVQTFSR